jgi:[ribosomal protein S5]-alanine N-acetyltransferase
LILPTETLSAKPGSWAGTDRMDGSDLPACTDRLRFGIWREEDGPLAAAIWGDPEVTLLTGGPFSARQVAERLREEIENWQRFAIQYWPLFRVSDGHLVGCCGLRPRDIAAGILELGFQLCRDNWRQGFATEASCAVIDWARARGIAALIAGHHPSNGASERTLRGLGFAYTHHELYPLTGEMEPCYFLRLDGPKRFPLTP